MDVQRFFRQHPRLLLLPETYRDALPLYLRWMPPALCPTSKFELNALMKARGVPFAQDRRFVSRCTKRFIEEELFGDDKEEPLIIWRMPLADEYQRVLCQLSRFAGQSVVNEVQANPLRDEEDE